MRVFIDLDNTVFLKNTKIKSYYVRRNHAFISKYVRSANRTVIPELHRYITESCGHPVLGLRRLGFDVSIETYNKFIYPNELDYEALWGSSNDAEALLRFAKDHQVVACSNSPHHWTDGFLTCFSTALAKHISYADISNDPKPLQSAFDRLGVQPNDYYIDSDPKNVLSALSAQCGLNVIGVANENWKFSDSRLVFVRHLQEAHTYINYDKVRNAMNQMPPR